MSKTTFMDELLAGKARPADIEGWVERWHALPAPHPELHVYLGLTWPEYGQWVAAGALPNAAQREPGFQPVRLQGGERIYAHGPQACQAPCSIHWPTAHPMRGWPQHWRGDRQIMERLCPGHGVGHPDPDDRAIRLGTDSGVHGCCGCCSSAGQFSPKESESQVR